MPVNAQVIFIVKENYLSLVYNTQYNIYILNHMYPRQSFLADNALTLYREKKPFIMLGNICCQTGQK